jgi:hypothetical protein
VRATMANVLKGSTRNSTASRTWTNRSPPRPPM